MSRSITTRVVGLALLLALALGVGGCGSEDDDPDAAADGGSTSAEAEQPASDDGPPFGPECQDVLAAWGQDSAAALADLPYPDLLKTGMRRSNGLFAQAGLLDQEDVTLFVPTESAISGLSVEELEPLLLDRGHIRKVMRRHVVSGRLAPSELAGEHTTIDGDTLTIEVSGDEVKVGSEGALVTCGNIQTLDATLYLIDDVLVS